MSRSGASNVFADAVHALDDGRGVALATVTGVRGSTPRHLGARMAIADDGEQWGTIGGGRIEQLVAAAAREVAGGAPSRVVRRHLVRDLAMCCGGSMEVVLTSAAPSRAVLGELVGLSAEEPRLLATPIDGGPLELRALVAGAPHVHRPTIVDGALIERVGVAERAIVFGAGHVGRALGPLLASLGFVVVICDDDETGALTPPPAWAASVVDAFEVPAVERAIGELGAHDCVLIVTRDHAIDQRLLEQLIGNDDIGYLGMIGSRGKVGRFHKRLAARGLIDGEVGEARWARLRAPVGLDIGAETPAEIAIAIAAELVAWRRRGIGAAGTWGSERGEPVDTRTPVAAAGDGDPNVDVEPIRQRRG